MREIVTSNPDEMFSWLDKTDLFLTTINTTVNNYGELIMGAGHALAVKKRFPGIERKFADAIAREAKPFFVTETQSVYDFVRQGITYKVYADVGLLVSQNWPRAKVGGFQTKRRFWETANDGKDLTYNWLLHHLKNSTVCLMRFIRQHPNIRVDMPFPSIGNAGMPIDTVRGIIRHLPDNVFVWRLEKPSQIDSNNSPGD